MNSHRKVKQTQRISERISVPHSKALSQSKQIGSKSFATTKKNDDKASPKAKRSLNSSQVKKKQTAPRTEAQYAAKPEKFKGTYDRVISTVAKMRTEKLSLAQASRETGVTPRTVRRWASSALRKRPNGTYAAKPSDNLLRLVRIPTLDGPREIAVRGSKQVRLLAEYSNALHRYLQTGDATKLKSFEGKFLTDASGVEIPLSVDLIALNRLGSAGVLSFESIYARTT